jgi:hypothetical protein
MTTSKRTFAKRPPVALTTLALALTTLAGCTATMTEAARPGDSVQQPLGSATAPVAGRVLGRAIHTRDGEELQYYVMKDLFDRYAHDQGIGVSSAEIDDYLTRARAAMARDRQEALAKRDELTRRLAAGKLGEAERAALAQDLKNQEMLIEGLAGADGRNDSAEDKAARAQIAEAFILQWKVNRALHQQYGGRIVYQQTGPEPLDARRRFLEDRQAKGDFTILDKQLEPGFWGYFRTDSIHDFYPSGSPEEKAAFARPPWQEN